MEITKEQMQQDIEESKGLIRQYRVHTIILGFLFAQTADIISDHRRGRHLTVEEQKVLAGEIETVFFYLGRQMPHVVKAMAACLSELAKIGPGVACRNIEPDEYLAELRKIWTAKASDLNK